jgi:hypothetical protein
MSNPEFENIGDAVTCTIEECAEVIHVLCKVQRFGWTSHNPYDKDKTPNFVLVQWEVNDLKKRIAQLEKEIKEKFSNE